VFELNLAVLGFYNIKSFIWEVEPAKRPRICAHAVAYSQLMYVTKVSNLYRASVQCRKKATMGGDLALSLRRRKLSEPN